MTFCTPHPGGLPFSYHYGTLPSGLASLQQQEARRCPGSPRDPPQVARFAERPASQQRVPVALRQPPSAGHCLLGYSPSRQNPARHSLTTTKVGPVYTRGAGRTVDGGAAADGETRPGSGQTRLPLPLEREGCASAPSLRVLPEASTHASVCLGAPGMVEMGVLGHLHVQDFLTPQKGGNGFSYMASR